MLNKIHAWVPTAAIKVDENGKKFINWTTLRYAHTQVRLFATKKDGKEAYARYEENLKKTPPVTLVTLNFDAPDGAHFKVIREQDGVFGQPRTETIGRFTHLKDAVTVADGEWADTIRMVYPANRPNVYDTIAQWRKGKNKKVQKKTDVTVFWRHLRGFDGATQELADLITLA
jgi:hypothetical protein